MEITRLVVGMVETNCYIALNPQNKEAAIVDPGDNAPKIIETCGKLGASVKAILLTHGHFDHVMAMEELRLKYKAPVFASEQEAGVLADPDEFELIGYQFKVIHTPGHTCGSCCYYIASEKVLFAGDTLFEGSYGRIDFPTGNSREMINSVANVLFGLPEDTDVYPGHMGYTTIGDEKRYNPLAGYRGREL